VLGIPHFVFSEQSEWKEELSKAIILTKKINHPVALVVEDKFFSDYDIAAANPYELSAGQVIEALFPLIDENTLVVCTTGKIGRLFYAVNEKNNFKIKKYLLNIGAMGHASSIALGLARFSDNKIVLLDGDGSLLMHMGSLAIAGTTQVNSLNYIVLNNGSHQSVGGQPTKGLDVDFSLMAKACGFENSIQIISEIQFKKWVETFQSEKQFVEIRINTNMPESLPRPKESFTAAKENLMKALKILPE
jgi:phosphonopyruvate decarboxylase